MKPNTGISSDSGPVNVTKRGRFYHYEIMVDGQRARGSTKCTDEAQAVRKAQAKKREMIASAASFAEADDPTDAKFDHAADECWNAIKMTLRTTGERPSVNARRREFKRAVHAFGPTTMCSAMDFALFVKVRDRLLLEPPPVRKRGRPRKSEKMLCPKTVNKVLEIALRILRFAKERLGLSLPKMPVPPLYEVLLTETPRSQYLRQGPQQERLLEHCEQDLRDLIEFDLETGLRSSELFALRWEAVDTLEESIRVNVKGRGHEPIPHTVYLSERASEILDRRRNGAQSEYVFSAATGITYRRDDVTIEKGSQVQYNYNRMHRELAPALALAGITDFTFHDLRRTAARRLWWDSNLEIAQAFLRHKDPKTTLDYLGLTDKDIQAAQRHRAAMQARRQAEIEKAISRGLPPPEIEDLRVRRIQAQFLLEKRLAAGRNGTGRFSKPELRAGSDPSI